ncbi:MAG: NAD(P)H-dependent oxidoreductase [Clostridiales bacterium]|nr:NAD(P)H-dependent oxidoreductase [Clostridiales bacterium]
MAKIGILVGSLREDSYSRKIALNVVDLFPEGYELELVEIGHLPFYNQDFDDKNAVPDVIEKYRSKIKEFDAFLFVTPEYNRSLPAVLKNAIDVGSRPPKSNLWGRKPAAIISNSPGKISGFGANHHLRQVIACLNMPVVQQPEVYIGNVAKLLDDNGKINSEYTNKLLQRLVDEFVELIKRYKA